MFALAVNTRGDEGWKQLKCVSALAGGKCDGCAGRPMAGDAGVCVGVKGMLAARKDKKKKKKEEERALSMVFESKVCVFLGERVSSIPRDGVLPEVCEMLRFLKVRFRGAGIGLVLQAWI